MSSKKRNWIIASVALMTVTMTISDSYYSKLEKEFPLLSENELTEGSITSFKSHFGYTYVEIGSNTKRLIRPTNVSKAGSMEFHDFIQIGDKFLHRKSDHKVVVYRQNLAFEFLLVNQYN